MTCEQMGTNKKIKILLENIKFNYESMKVLSYNDNIIS